MTMAQSIPSRLDDYLRRCPAFDWQRHNCCQFAAAWVREVEGTGPAAPGASGALEAQRHIARRGGSLREAVTRALHRAPLAGSQARPGDLVLVVGLHWPARQAVGICAGRTAVLLGHEGPQHVPMAAASVAWRVGAA